MGNLGQLDEAIRGGFLHNMMYVLGILTGCIYMIIVCRIKLPKDKWYQVQVNYWIIVALGLGGAIGLAKLMNAVMAPPDEHKIRLLGAVILIPIAAFPIARITVRERVTDRLDVCYPVIFLVMAFAKVGCHFAGCCNGIPAEWGIVHYAIKYRLFPVQLAEAAAIIFSILVVRLFQRTKYFKRGSGYPLMMLMFCITRFGLEYFRAYSDPAQKDFLWGMTIWQTFCLFTALMAVIWLVLRPRFIARLEAVEAQGPEINIFNRRAVLRAQAEAAKAEKAEKAAQRRQQNKKGQNSKKK